MKERLACGIIVIAIAFVEGPGGVRIELVQRP